MKTIAQSFVAMTLLCGSAFATINLEESPEKIIRKQVKKALSEVGKDLKVMQDEIREIRQEKSMYISHLKSQSLDPKFREEVEVLLQNSAKSEEFLVDELSEITSQAAKLKDFKARLKASSINGEPLDQSELGRMFKYLMRHHLLEETEAPRLESTVFAKDSWLVWGFKSVEKILRHPATSLGLLLSPNIIGAAASTAKQCPVFTPLRSYRSEIIPKHAFITPYPHNATLIQHFEVEWTMDVLPGNFFRDVCPLSEIKPSDFMAGRDTSPSTSLWSLSTFVDGKMNYKAHQNQILNRLVIQKGNYQVHPDYSHLYAEPCWPIPRNVSVADSGPCTASDFTPLQGVPGEEQRCQVSYHCPWPDNLRVNTYSFNKRPCDDLPTDIGWWNNQTMGCERTLTPTGSDQQGTPLCSATYICPEKNSHIMVELDVPASLRKSVGHLIRQARDELVERVKSMMGRAAKQ